MSRNRFRYQNYILCIFCMYAMCAFDVCILCMFSMYLIHVLYACILCMYSRHIVHEWKDGTDEAISELLVFGAISHYFFFSKPNERNSPEIIFIWTLARRERNARNFQEIHFSWTYQFLDAAGTCLLQVQPKSKSTELSRIFVHSAPVQPGSK